MRWMDDGRLPVAEKRYSMGILFVRIKPTDHNAQTTQR